MQEDLRRDDEKQRCEKSDQYGFVGFLFSMIFTQDIGDEKQGSVQRISSSHDESKQDKLLEDKDVHHEGKDSNEDKQIVLSSAIDDEGDDEEEDGESEKEKLIHGRRLMDIRINGF